VVISLLFLIALKRRKNKVKVSFVLNGESEERMQRKNGGIGHHERVGEGGGGGMERGTREKAVQAGRKYSSARGHADIFFPLSLLHCLIVHPHHFPLPFRIQLGKLYAISLADVLQHQFNTDIERIV
jgi:hypothetical protein